MELSAPTTASQVLVTRAAASLVETGSFRPDGDFRTFLGNSRLATVEAENGMTVRLASPESVMALLETAWQTGQRGRELRQLSHGLQDGYMDRDRIQEEMLDEAHHELASTGNLFGPIAMCGCGVPGCGSEYAWILDRTCLCHTRLSGCSLREIEFFPFEVLASWRDPRWVQRERESPLLGLRACFDEWLMTNVDASQFEQLCETGALALDHMLPQPKEAREVMLVSERGFDRTHSNFDLQDYLSHTRLCEFLSVESMQAGDRTVLGLVSALSLAELLLTAAKHSRVEELGRMHYSATPPSHWTAGMAEWREGSRLLCRSHYLDGRMKFVHLFPEDVPRVP